MRDPKEIVLCVDSLVAVVIGILLTPLGVSLAPIDEVLVVRSDSMCEVQSLLPLGLVTWMAIVCIEAATIMSKMVQVRYTKPSINPPFKIKVYAYGAWICIALAHVLSMVIVIMCLEVKLQKFTCLPIWVQATLTVTIVPVILGFFNFSYVWLCEASDAAPAAPVAAPVAPVAAPAAPVAAPAAPVAAPAAPVAAPVAISPTEPVTAPSAATNVVPIATPSAAPIITPPVASSAASPLLAMSLPTVRFRQSVGQVIMHPVIAQSAAAPHATRHIALSIPPPGAFPTTHLAASPITPLVASPAFPPDTRPTALIATPPIASSTASSSSTLLLPTVRKSAGHVMMDSATAATAPPATRLVASFVPPPGASPTARSVASSITPLVASPIDALFSSPVAPRATHPTAPIATHVASPAASPVVRHVTPNY